jgi:TPR repeat protein
MRFKSLQLWILPLTVGTACVHVQGAQDAEAPRPGLPQQELALLERDYDLYASRCSRTAEEVVEIHRRCDEEHWADCVYAATMYLQGCGVAQNAVQAEALYQRACGFGSALGCSMAGARTKDFDRGIALLEEPCALGYVQACGWLGVQLYNRGQESDVARTVALLERACRQSEIKFCGALGQAVTHWKIEPQFAATRTLLDHACQEQDLSSCYMLAMALEDGSLGNVDYDRAAALHWALCHQRDHLPSCNALGYMAVLGRGDEKDPRKGSMLFYVACSRGYGPACDSMGEATEKGWGVPASPQKALPFYDRGCELAVEVACQNARRLRAAGVVEPVRN